MLTRQDHRFFKESGGKNLNQTLGMTNGYVGAAALWEGGDTRFGKTAWESLDATVATAVTTEVMKRTFARARLAQKEGLDAWLHFQRIFILASGGRMEIALRVVHDVRP